MLFLSGRKQELWVQDRRYSRTCILCLWPILYIRGHFRPQKAHKRTNMYTVTDISKWIFSNEAGFHEKRREKLYPSSPQVFLCAHNQIVLQPPTTIPNMVAITIKLYCQIMFKSKNTFGCETDVYGKFSSLCFQSVPSFSALAKNIGSSGTPPYHILVDQVKQFNFMRQTYRLLEYVKGRWPQGNLLALGFSPDQRKKKAYIMVECLK